METPTDILTVHEAAAILRVAVPTLYAWAEKGKVPSFKLGRLRRFRRSELWAWIETQADSATTKTEAQDANEAQEK